MRQDRFPNDCPFYRFEDLFTQANVSFQVDWFIDETDRSLNGAAIVLNPCTNPFNRWVKMFFDRNGVYTHWDFWSEAYEAVYGCEELGYPTV